MFVLLVCSSLLLMCIGVCVLIVVRLLSNGVSDVEFGSGNMILRLDEVLR